MKCLKSFFAGLMSLTVFVIMSSSCYGAIRVTCAELNRNITGYGTKMLVVDVRGSKDYSLGHIVTALNVSYEFIGKAEFPREAMSTFWV